MYKRGLLTAPTPVTLWLIRFKGRCGQVASAFLCMPVQRRFSQDRQIYIGEVLKNQ